MAKLFFFKRIFLQFGLMLILLLSFQSPLAKVKNIKPLAIAGSAQSVTVHTLVTLDGSNSRDNDGKISKWSWTQTKGTKVKLTNANKAIAKFTSPKLKAKTKTSVLAFKLTVTDNNKATATASIQVTVTIQPSCVLPQILENNTCITPPPVCVSPQILTAGICVDPIPACKTGQILLNGVCVTPNPACETPRVLKNGFCVLPKPVCNLPLVIKDNTCVAATTSNPFNDTGIVDCSDGAYNLPGCGIAQFPNQDAEVGRDANNYNDSDGQAGFSFSKISASGAELPLNAEQWACIKDNVTGLLWENKTNDNGLHDKNRGFSFYSPTANPKNEYGTSTDATGFINAVNNQSLCGANNWRLPSNTELQSIINYGFPLPGPAIDENFFSNTANNAFWTSSPFLRDSNGAWLVYFDDGRIFDDYRNRDGGGSIRLVSGSSNFGHDYSISADGQEVTDNVTGLIWQRCVQGMQWDGTSCAGSPSSYMFQESLQLAQKQRNNSGINWRLPNVKELASLLDTSQPGLAIDGQVFPNSPHDQYWTSSPFSNDAFFAWIVHFFHGSVYYTYTEDLGIVRLVRDKN